MKDTNSPVATFEEVAFEAVKKTAIPFVGIIAVSIGIAVVPIIPEAVAPVIMTIVGQNPSRVNTAINISVGFLEGLLGPGGITPGVGGGTHPVSNLVLRRVSKRIGIEIRKNND
jgi:sorbitol-specific phosphotransferase system component IIBC